MFEKEKKKVPSTGIEPGPATCEADVVSTELRGAHVTGGFLSLVILQPVNCKLESLLPIFLQQKHSRVEVGKHHVLTAFAPSKEIIRVHIQLEVDASCLTFARAMSSATKRERRLGDVFVQVGLVVGRVDQEQYQTSAVLGSALDSFYCGLKLKNQPLDLTQLLGQLTGVGRRMASLSCSFPLGLPENGLLENHSCIPVPLTPGAVADARQDISLAVVRGCPQDLISRLPRSVQDPGEVVHRFADKMCGGGLAWLMRVENPTRTANGFPAIFDEAVTPRGLISKHPREKNTGVALVPSLVCVQSGSGTARGLQEVVHAGSSLDLQRFHRCTLAGTEPDAFKEALNAVQELASDYDLGL